MDKFTAFSMTSFLLMSLLGFMSSSDAVWIPPCHKVVKRNARMEKLIISNKEDKISHQFEMNAGVTDGEKKENIRKPRHSQVDDILDNLEKLEKLERENFISGGFLVLPSKSCDNPWTTLYIPQLNSLLPKYVVDLLSSHNDNMSPLPTPEILRETRKVANNKENVPRTFKIYLQSEPEPITYQESVPIPSPDGTQMPLAAAQVHIPLAPHIPVSNAGIVKPQLSQPSHTSYPVELSPPPVKTTGFVHAYSNPIYTDKHIKQTPVAVSRQNISHPQMITQPEPTQTTYIHTNPNCPHFTGYDQNFIPLRQQQTYQYVQSYK